MPSSFTFSTKAHSIDSIPTNTQQLVQDADGFLTEILKTWKKNKTYNYKLHNGSKEAVTTYGKTIDGEYWLARISQHNKNKHSDFVKHLVGERDAEGNVKDVYTHSKNETKYIEVLDKWEPIPLDSYPGFAQHANKEQLEREWVSIKAFYELGAPLTTREFNEFLFVQPPVANDSTQTGYVIQLVADKALESSNVRGLYCSIERVRLLENGETEWIMCTTSDSGGNVPKWLQNSMISKSVSGDVPGFLNWLNANVDN